MIFKAVVVDVDGTITYSDRSIDCKAVTALRSLHVPVVVATGDVLGVVRAVAKLLGTSGIVIAENGGVVECGKVESDTSHIKECREALEILKQYFSPLEMLDLENRITEIGLRRTFDAEEARKSWVKMRLWILWIQDSRYISRARRSIKARDLRGSRK